MKSYALEVCAILCTVLIFLIFLMMFVSPQYVHKVQYDDATCYLTPPGGISCIPREAPAEPT